MPKLRRVDPLEAAWGYLLAQVQDVQEDFGHIRSETYYWRMIAMLDYPPETWVDPPNANSIAWLAVHMPGLVERRETGERYPRYHYRLTAAGRSLAERFAEYERKREQSNAS